jgi:hypothetical protein
MSRRLAPSRLTHLLLALTMITGASALDAGCKKPADDGSSAPGEGGGAKAPKTGELLLRYKAGAFSLKENAKISVTFTAGQTGSFSVDATGLLEVSDQGGKLKVAHKILEVRDLKMEGAMKPEAKDGKPPPDPKEALLKATGASLVDLRGETDAPGTKALAENKKEPGKEDDDFAGVGDFLGLPQLPEPALVLGKPVKHEKQDEQAMGGLKIPTEEEATYTLLKIDQVDGRRLAEIKFESESSGAVETQGQLISIDGLSEGTIVFDLDAQLPVRVHIEQTQNFSFGSQGSGESRVVIDATYEPA